MLLALASTAILDPSSRRARFPYLYPPGTGWRVVVGDAVQEAEVYINRQNICCVSAAVKLTALGLLDNTVDCFSEGMITKLSLYIQLWATRPRGRSRVPVPMK
jgi:hypothetical protein